MVSAEILMVLGVISRPLSVMRIILTISIFDTSSQPDGSDSLENTIAQPVNGSNLAELIKIVTQFHPSHRSQTQESAMTSLPFEPLHPQSDIPYSISLSTEKVGSLKYLLRTRMVQDTRARLLTLLVYLWTQTGDLRCFPPYWTALMVLWFLRVRQIPFLSLQIFLTCPS